MEYYEGIGHLSGDAQVTETGNGYVVIQSLWTKPILQGEQDYARRKKKMQDTLFMCALSLAYAHRTGYKVHMHTDSVGERLLSGFGYDAIFVTLDDIPSTVPMELFAAGKCFAMRAEGTLKKAHIDIDVFLKKPCLNRFYEDNHIDAICQMEEDISEINHSDKIKHMYVLGYPSGTRPDWKGSMNTGVIGFNNPLLAARYMSNYFEALKMYTQEKFDSYRAELRKAKELEPNLRFDFILEQVNLSHMSIGYNIMTLVPTKEPGWVADKIGYCHLQGTSKQKQMSGIRSRLIQLDRKLFERARLNGITVLRKFL